MLSGGHAMFNIIAIAIGVYSALVGGLYLVQRELIYHPTQPLPSPEISGVPEMKVVRLTTEDGLILTSWYRPAQGDLPTIVYFQGNGGNIAGRGNKVLPYLDAGFGVLLAGYRGYGGNPGRPSEQGLYADGRAHLEFLKNQNIPSNQWVLYGESLGSGVAVQMAFEWVKQDQIKTNTSIGSVVLEAPFSSLGDAAQSHYPFVPARLLVKDHFDSIAKIDKIKAPLFVVNGDMDGVIPPIQGRRLFNAAREPKEGHWVQGSGHNNLYDFGVSGPIIDFISRNHAISN